jgi:hypothetical protein
VTPRNIDSVNALDAPPKPVLELSGRCIDRFVTCRRCTLDPDPPCLAPTATCVVMAGGCCVDCPSRSFSTTSRRRGSLRRTPDHCPVTQSAARWRAFQAMALDLAALDLERLPLRVTL